MKDKGTLIRIKKSVQLAQIKDNESILDLGCGDSYIKNFLPTNTNYTGIDLHIGDICHDLECGLPDEIIGNRYDIIFMNEFIEHIENFVSLFQCCKNCLTPTGRIIISTPSNNRILISEDKTHIHCFRMTNMQNLARRCGLNLEQTMGTYIQLFPIVPYSIIISTNQTYYTEVIIYLLTDSQGRKPSAPR
ncbi:MAG: class I SAM-dependent methyltransferase [Methanosarcinales archaeon]|nr:class I SAM-dependent methyltransferase [Methanosarcinales archaeon]